MRDDDDSPVPSLLLAGHEKAHREHLLNQRHQHNKFHKRQSAEAITTASAAVLTEVSVTVSVVQQIDVDSNGSTFSILTVPADATGNGSQAVLTGSSTPSTTTAAAVASTYSASGASSTASGSSETNSSSLISQSSSQSATTASTSTPSVPASFASLIVSSNSTTLISSSSSLSHTFTNSSSLSSSRSSLTYLTSSSPSTSFDESSTTSTSSFNTFSSTYISFQSTSTGSGGIIVGGTPVTPGTATSTAATSGNGTNSNSGSSVSTSAVVGGVVGSIAGVAVIALLLLFLVKWRKNRNGTLLSLGSGRDGAGDTADTATGGQPPQPTGGMVERRSFAYAVPAALASLTGYKRSSRQTDRTVSSTAGSERGFYRVSGRKLPSVLQTGGDGYGGGVPDDNTLSGSSFYRDSHGFYGGPGTPTFPTLETHRESGQIGTPVMRPSPARTPVTEQGPFSAVPSPLDQLPPPRPDVLGRSHPSQDGSHASRFTEEV